MAAYGFQGFSLENPYEPKKAKAPIPGAPAVPADTPIGPAPGQPAQGGGAKSAAPPRPAGSTFTPPRVGGQEGTMGQQGGGLPYGTGDNRRQAGQMPLKGAVGAPPAGGFTTKSWGPPGSGSAGQGNMPGPARGGPGGFGGPGGRTDLGGGGGNVRPGGDWITGGPGRLGPPPPTDGRPIPPPTPMPGLPPAPFQSGPTKRILPGGVPGQESGPDGFNPGFTPGRGVPGGTPVDQPTTTMSAAPAGMPNWWKPQPVSPGTGMQGGGPAIANPYEQPRRAAAPQQDGGGSTGVAPATPAPIPDELKPGGGGDSYSPGTLKYPGGGSSAPPSGGGISV